MINWIAHRGLMSKYAENTTVSIQKALDAGARFVEFDIQFSNDLVPMVIHDATLERTTTLSFPVRDCTAQTIQERTVVREPIPSHEKVFVPRLSDVVDILNDHGLVTAFVEIKEESLEYLSAVDAVDIVWNVIDTSTNRGPRFRPIIISENDQVVRAAQQRWLETGLVLYDYSYRELYRTKETDPDFIFVDVDDLPPSTTELWRGPWEWAVYDICNIDHARALENIGATYIETCCIDEMLKNA